MRPGEPHLLAGRVERHRQPRQDPVIDADRVVLQKDPRLGIDEGRGRAMGDRDPLGHSRRAGGEDDPGVVARGDARHTRRSDSVSRGGGGGGDGAPGAHDGSDGCLREDEVGALLRVVGIDRHVGRPGPQHGEDRDVEVVGARRGPNADAVTGPHPGRREGGRHLLDPLAEGAVSQDRPGVVEGCGSRVCGDRGVKHVEQGACRRGPIASEQRVGHRHSLTSRRPRRGACGEV